MIRSGDDTSEILGGRLAVLVAWKPWVNDFKIRLSFPSAAPVEPTLTEQLVFDVPPAKLSAASLGTGEDALKTLADVDGYFFAAPNAESLGMLAIRTSEYAELKSVRLQIGSMPSRTAMLSTTGAVRCRSTNCCFLRSRFDRQRTPSGPKSANAGFD